MIGLIPALRALSQNSKAPNRKPWSVVAIAVCPSRAVSANRSSSLAAPSSIEYSVCTWRWTKSEPPAAAMRTSLGRRSDTSVLRHPGARAGSGRLAQPFPGHPEILGILRGDLERAARHRVLEGQPDGVQPLASQAEPVRQHR